MSEIRVNFAGMPRPLKVLTLLSLMSALLVVATIIPGGAVVGPNKVELRNWWDNGSGLVFLAAVGLFFSAGVLLLQARQVGRLVYLSGFAGLYIATYVIERINGVSYASGDYLYGLLLAALQIAALSAYFFLSPRVRNFLVR